MLVTALSGFVSSAFRAGRPAAGQQDDVAEIGALLRRPESYPLLVWLAVAATFGYLLLLLLTGFFLTTSVFTFALLCLGHYRRWLRGALLSAARQFPSLGEMIRIRVTIIRSTVPGTLVGIVPGAGATITSFISYGIEKQYARWRHLLGTGLPEGIVAPQIGATASVAGHMIPRLTLGLRGSGATAVILAAFLHHGVQPGPMLFEDPASTVLVDRILASMFLSVIGMCLLGFLWIRVIVKVLTIPQGILSAIVVMFCLIGAYANRNDLADVWMIVFFGVLGYLFEKFNFPIAPMVLGAILGPIGESSFVRSMIGSGNDWSVFFKDPISGTLMGASFLALGYPLLRGFISRRRVGAAIAAGEPR